MRLLITICARGGSKGLPGKNIKPIDGKPLIAFTIKHALNFQEAHQHVDILLSTDSIEIQKIAEQSGLKTDYTRPENLAGDTVGKVAVIRDALRYTESKTNIRYDLILDLDVTSPLRTQEDLESGFQKAILSNKLILFSVSEAHKNPYFNLVEFDGKDLAISKESGGYLSRQSAPTVYEINGSFYFYKREFFDLNIEKVTERGIFDIYLMDHPCHDVDNEVDFQYLKFLIESGNSSISL